jgi:hypothetical protein
MLCPLHNLKVAPVYVILKLHYENAMQKVKPPFKNLLQCILINWFCQYVTTAENNKYVVLVTPTVLTDMQD